MTIRTGQRAAADERRDQVLAAAIVEFAEHGYHAARTAAIAERAGISQPYVYALFQNKKVLFLAVQSLVHERIQQAFAGIWHESGSSAEGLGVLALAYRALMADRNLLRCQLQGYAATSDQRIRDHMRQLYMTNFDTVTALTGLEPAEVARFFATGMLLNVGAALELPHDYAFAPPLP